MSQKNKCWRLSVVPPSQDDKPVLTATDLVVWAETEKDAMWKWSGAVNGRLTAYHDDTSGYCVVVPKNGGYTIWYCHEEPDAPPHDPYEGYQGMTIESLIDSLEEEQKRGATMVYVDGTLLTNRHNSVMMTNEPQI